MRCHTVQCCRTVRVAEREERSFNEEASHPLSRPLVFPTSTSSAETSPKTVGRSGGAMSSVSRGKGGWWRGRVTVWTAPKCALIACSLWR